MSRTGPTLLLAVVVIACADGGGGQPGDEPGSASQPPAQQSARSLSGNAVEPGTVALDGLEKVDLAAGLASGAIAILANDPSIEATASSVVDGSLETLVRSDNVNPLVLTIALQEQIRLRAVRVYLTYSTHDWVLMVVPGEERLLAKSVPPGVWSQIDLAETADTSEVRLDLLRLERDDYVHANEIELYVEPAP